MRAHGVLPYGVCANSRVVEDVDPYGFVCSHIAIKTVCIRRGGVSPPANITNISMRAHGVLPYGYVQIRGSSGTSTPTDLCVAILLSKQCERVVGDVDPYELMVAILLSKRL